MCSYPVLQRLVLDSGAKFDTACLVFDEGNAVSTDTGLQVRLCPYHFISCHVVSNNVSIDHVKSRHRVPYQALYTSTPWISPHYLFRAVHAAAAIPTHPCPNAPSSPTTRTIA